MKTLFKTAIALTAILVAVRAKAIKQKTQHSDSGSIRIDSECVHVKAAKISLPASTIVSNHYS